MILVREATRGGYVSTVMGGHMRGSEGRQQSATYPVLQFPWSGVNSLVVLKFGRDDEMRGLGWLWRNTNNDACRAHKLLWTRFPR